jgi:hypothetical protein
MGTKQSIDTDDPGKGGKHHAQQGSSASIIRTKKEYSAYKKGIFGPIE